MHKALDKAGAVIGPLAAYALLSWLGESARSYRLLFWIAVLPAVASLLVLAFIREQPGVRHERESIGRHWHELSPGFKRFLLPAGIFALGYYSVGFLLLRAHETGFSITDTVLLYALFNGVCVITAPLVGRLGDRIGRQRIMLLAYALHGVINLGLMLAGSMWSTTVLFALYGGFYAAEDSQSNAFIADIEPDRRATAMGAYNFITGVLYLPASLAAGALWTLAPAYAFSLAALLSLIAVMTLARLRPGAVAAGLADPRHPRGQHPDAG